VRPVTRPPGGPTAPSRGAPLQAVRSDASPDLLQGVPPVAQRQPARSPGPSKLAYRLARIWAKTWLRRAVLMTPVLCLGLVAGRVAMSPAVAVWIEDGRQAAVAALSSRPEFALREFRVQNASPALERAIGAVVELPPGASSLTLDVAAVQARVAALGAVRNVRVTLGPDGILRIAVDERIAEALWRPGDNGGHGTLHLVDREGVAIGPAGPRADHPGLPVVLGEGAPAAMAEALALFHAVPELRPRLRAFVRVGQRRWDVALDRDLTIKLPETGAEAALARVMALHYGEELLDRDLGVIDMRLGDRPTLRMTPRALEALRLLDAAGDDPGRRT
jgi:cell division protein FtsQ